MHKERAIPMAGRTRASCFASRLALLVLVQAFACVCPALVRAQAAPTVAGRMTLPGSIRPVSTDHADLTAALGGAPRPAFSRELTAAEAATPLKVEIVLKTRHYQELQARVAKGETISAAEMAERYLPRQSDFQAVSKWLTLQGLSVQPAGPGRAMAIASGSAPRLEAAFQTRFARVVFRGAEYTAAVSAPSLPPEVAALVMNIHGLQPFLHPHKSAVPAASASAIQPPYTVDEIRQAYDIEDATLTGAGQQIGIIIDTVPADSDLTQFWSANDVSQSLTNIIPVNVSGGSLPRPSGEETLDVSWSSGIAPGAQIVIYACGDLSNVDESYSQILDDLQSGARPNLHQISMSYASGEVTDETSSDMDSTSQMFTSMAAYGVTLFAASGDNGADGAGGNVVQVNYPASDPDVVGVGGTTLTLGSTGAEATETAWSFSGRGSGASGGGISSHFSRPSWQTGSTVPAGTMRLVPDVSFDADPNTGCYLIFQGQESEYGGTSWSSPTWAGMCALLNQARAAAGLSALGVATKALYPLLGTTSFRDITSGSNGAYSAGAGYDMVTGIGVPDFDVLLSALVGSTAAASAPAITSSSTATGEVGTAFTYQITASGSPTSFAATGLPAGLSVSAAGLISGVPTEAGTFSVTLTATNSTGAGTAVLALTIAVAAPTITSALSANGQVGVAFTYQITASGSPTSFGAAGLPAGLSIGAGTGLISGKPTAAGSFPVTLEATNAGGAGSATMTLTVASAPVVTIAAVVPEVTSLGGEAAKIAVTRTGGVDAPLTVHYTIRGTAQPGVDYAMLKGSRTIGAGKQTATIKVAPLGSDLGNSASVTVRLILEAPANAGYTVGTPNSAKVRIVAGQ